jgi:hypothetical protein
MSTPHLEYNRSLAPQFDLLLDVGNPASEEGLTRVRLDGDGDFVAQQLFAGTDAQAAAVQALHLDDQKWGTEEQLPAVRGRIEPDRAADLLEQAVAFPWDQRFPSRPGIPDEAIVVARFGPKGGPHSTVKLWLREAESDPAVGPVLEELRRVLDEFSHGEIYL